MKNIFTIILLVLCSYSAPADELQYFGFGDQNINSIETKTFSTPLPLPVQIRNISASEGIIIKNAYISDNTIYAEITLEHNQNISYRGVVFFGLTAFGNIHFSYPVIITANLFYNDDYDNYTFNKYGAELKSSLKQTLDEKHTTLSYKDARTQMWGFVDNYNGIVECVYTGRTIETSGIPDVTITKFNTEHSWPQAHGADVEPPKSDIFHMYPSYETANSRRANTRYGNVTSGILWQEGGSKLGKNSNGTEVFEARDINKGNVARGLFYFCLKYNNPDQFINDQYLDLLEWHYFDMPDTTENNRNNRIEIAQGDRNPFIDHPEFVERLNLIGDFVPEQMIVSSDTILTVISGLQNTLQFYSNIDTKLEYLNIEGCNFTPIIPDSNLYGGYPFTVQIAAGEPNCSGKCYVKFIDYDQVFEYTLTEQEINSINEEDCNYFINVYPNPSQGEDIIIQINAEDFSFDNYELSVSNYIGQRIDLSGTLEYNQADKSITIPYNALKMFGNSFIISIKNGEKSYQKSIIIK